MNTNLAELNTTNWADMVEESTVETPEVDTKGFSTPKGKKAGKPPKAPKKMPRNVVVVGEPPSDEGVVKKLTFEKKKVNLSNNRFAGFADSDSE